MQDIGHDMDDLFQRAAESYPLNPGKSDWDSIEKKLNENIEAAPAIVPVKKKRDKRFIILFLLLAFLFSGWMIYSNINHKSLPDIANNKSSQQARLPDKNKDINQNPQPGTLDINNDAKNSTASSLISQRGKVVVTNSNVTKESKNDNLGELSGNNSGFQNERFGNNIFDPEINSLLNNSYLDEISADLFIPGLGANIISDLQQLKLNDSLTLHTKTNSSSEKKNGIYFGVVAGPDFSKVHSGSFGTSGFQAGLLLGFRFSHKLSFETGFTWNRKNYQSNGKDFSMNKVGATMPSGMVINDLQSQSTIIEIPTKIKYDFAVKNYHDFFVAVGVSSYIMTREMNMYHVTLNGSNDKMLGLYKKK